MYQQSTISAITEIPALVYTFAAAAGWTVTGTSSHPILTRPGGGLSFELDASVSGSNHIVSWTQNGGAEATSNARVVSPKLNGTTVSPAVSLPSKVHLFADTDPEAFLVIVIEYAFNSYRHLYIGNLVKASAFDGGEVISGAQPYDDSNSVHFPISYRTSQYLFGAFRPAVVVVVEANSGGVYVDHVDNVVPWRTFYSHSTGPGHHSSFAGSEAIGGFCDDVNDGYMARGVVTFAGVQILVPINLYATMPITGDTLFTPLGYPAGIRMVNIADVEPGGEFTIGSQTWKCFPAFTKTSNKTVSQLSGGWNVSESSYYVGYAYPKD